MPKQRLKSATMNKRVPRGFSRENHDEPGSGSQYDAHTDGVSHQQYHGYTGHLSNTGMPPVNSVGNIAPQQQSQAHLTYMGSQGSR